MLPTALPASELYTSLQTGVVDAGENDAASVVSWGWVDVIKFYSLNEHSISCNVMMMNKKKMDGLPADVQKAIREAGKKAENYQLDYISGLAKSGRSGKKGEGQRYQDKPFRTRSDIIVSTAGDRQDLVGPCATASSSDAGDGGRVSRRSAQAQASPPCRGQWCQDHGGQHVQFNVIDSTVLRDASV
jgi:hypothetical protein